MSVGESSLLSQYLDICQTLASMGRPFPSPWSPAKPFTSICTLYTLATGVPSCEEPGSAHEQTCKISREELPHPIKQRRDEQRKFNFFVSLFPFEVPFNGLFAPTSQSRMSNIYRDSASLGKSNGKKWSNIWTCVFRSGLQLPHKKKFFLLILSWSTLLWHWCYDPHRSRDALSPVCGIFELFFLLH
jgi:hypothetical protein